VDLDPDNVIRTTRKGPLMGGLVDSKGKIWVHWMLAGAISSYDPVTRGGSAPDGRSPKATLHWLSARQAQTAEVRLYDHLFTKADPGADGDLLADLNPKSEEIVASAWVEPSLAGLPPGTRVQFERLGYFCVDTDSTAERPVFNRTVTLRDTWAKVQAKG